MKKLVQASNELQWWVWVMRTGSRGGGEGVAPGCPKALRFNGR